MLNALLFEALSEPASFWTPDRHPPRLPPSLSPLHSPPSPPFPALRSARDAHVYSGAQAANVGVPRVKKGSGRGAGDGTGTGRVQVLGGGGDLCGWGKEEGEEIAELTQ